MVSVVPYVIGLPVCILTDHAAGSKDKWMLKKKVPAATTLQRNYGC